MSKKRNFSEADFPWPKKGMPFWGQDDSKRTDAHIHWIRDLGFDLAEAFKTVGDFAVSELVRGGDGSHPDRFALPILYLYRHAIELQLKKIVRLGIELRLLKSSNGLEELLTSEHDLKRLWSKARMAMQAFWPKGNPGDLSIVQDYIFTLDQIDPDGQRFRYREFANPKTATGRTSAPLKTPAVDSLPEVFGLQYLAARNAELFGLLDGTEVAFTDALETLRGVEADYI